MIRYTEKIHEAITMLLACDLFSGMRTKGFYIKAFISFASRCNAQCNPNCGVGCYHSEMLIASSLFLYELRSVLEIQISLFKFSFQSPSRGDLCKIICGNASVNSENSIMLRS